MEQQERQEEYEGLFVLDPNLSEQELAKIQGQIAEQITKLGGTIERQQSWGKRRLAYRVKHRRDGYYQFMLFQIKTAAISPLEVWCSLNDQILRRLVVRSTGAPAPVQLVEASAHGESQ
ncbi:MAG: 30S ribosomal protein S6 [Candidatus Omnitrophica bacterium]|nr:30S ribosomal protein S6 [Candidatus Omnitrophota bacterium]